MSTQIDFAGLNPLDELTGNHLGFAFKGIFLDQSEKSVLLDVNGKINWYPKNSILAKSGNKRGANGKNKSAPIAGKDLEPVKQEESKIVLKNNPDADNSKTDFNKNHPPINSKPLQFIGKKDKTTFDGEKVIIFLRSKPAASLSEICDNIGKTLVSIKPIISELEKMGLILLSNSLASLTDAGKKYITGKPRKVKKATFKMPSSGPAETPTEIPGRNKREQVIYLLKSGMGKLKIARTIGCSRAYPGIVERQELEKTIKLKENN